MISTGVNFWRTVSTAMHAFSFNEIWHGGKTGARRPRMRNAGGRSLRLGLPSVIDCYPSEGYSQKCSSYA